MAAEAPPDALTLKWTYEAGDSIESSAAIADGTVYVGSSKGELLAIDLETGKLKWKYSTGEGGFIAESSPALAADAVFIGDLGGVLHAVNIRDGRKLWTFKADDEIRSSPVVLNDLVLIGSYDTHLYALEQKTGKLQWKLQTDGPVHATPAVSNGVIYLGGCDEQFRAVSAADGKTLFAVPIGSQMGASTAIDGDRAYVGTYGADVFAVDLRARKVAWSFRDPDREFPYYASPADANAAMTPARAGTEKKITRSIGWKFDNGSSDAKTTRSVPERIPTRIARSRCWNLAEVTEIDCSIRSDSKIVEFLFLAFVENQNAKRHKFTEKGIL